MWGGECLVQVHVHSVEAHVARPADAHERVQIGAVVVEHRPGRVHKLCYVQDLPLEQAQGVGVGQHQGRRARRQLGLEVGQADAAVTAGLDLHHLKAAEGGAGRVCPVGGVGDENLRASLTSGVLVSADHPQRRPLAVCAGGRLKGGPVDPHDRTQRLLEAPHQLERALDRRFVLVWVQVGEPWERRSRLVGDRVVLHRTAPQRVEVLADRVVQRSQPAVVAHDLGLAEPGQARGFRAQRVAGQDVRRRGSRHVGLRQSRRIHRGPAQLEAERLGHDRSTARSSSIA